MLIYASSVPYLYCYEVVTVHSVDTNNPVSVIPLLSTASIENPRGNAEKKICLNFILVLENKCLSKYYWLYDNIIFGKQCKTLPPKATTSYNRFMMENNIDMSCKTSIIVEEKFIPVDMTI